MYVIIVIRIIILLLLRRLMEMPVLGVELQLRIITLQRRLHFENVRENFQTSAHIKDLLNGLFYHVKICQFYIQVHLFFHTSVDELGYVSIRKVEKLDVAGIEKI